MPDDMMNAEAIETLAVQLVADAAPLLDSVDGAVEQAKEKLGAIGEPIPEVQAAMALLGAAFEDALAAEGKMASPEVLASIQQLIMKYNGLINATEDYAAKLYLVGQAEQEVRALRVQAEATGGIAAGPQTPQQALTGDLFAQVAGGRQAQGRGWGIMEMDAFGKKLGSLYTAAARLGVPFEQVTREAQGLAEAELGAARGGTALEQVFGGIFKKGFSAGGIIKMLGTRLLGVVAPAVLVFKAIQGLVKMFREAEQAAMAYDTSLYHLEVAVRAAQRVMGEQAGTIEQWSRAAADIAEKYGLYTVAAMNEVAATVRRTTLQFDLAADKAIALTDAGVALATAFGDTPGGVTSALAMFVSTGQNAEGLRQFGFDVTNVALQVQTMRMELEGLYSDLPADMQLQVRYNLIMEQSADMTADAAAAQTTLQGETRAAAVEMNTQMTALGQAWEPIARLARNIGDTVKLFFAKLITTVVRGAVMSVMGAMAVLGGLGEAITAEFEALERGGVLTWQQLSQAFLRGADEATARGERWVRDTISIFGRLGDEEAAAARATEQFGEDLAAAFLILQGIFADLDARIAETLSELENEYNDAIVELNADALRERQKATEDYQRETERDLQAHLLNMRRMEEDYLLELEDAVRARDARQVLLLMRQHRIAVRRADEDAAIRVRERRQGYLLELRDMDEQANRRRQLLYAEWQKRREEAIAEHAIFVRDTLDRFIKDYAITAEMATALQGLVDGLYGPGSSWSTGWAAVAAPVEEAARRVEAAAARIAAAASIAFASLAAVTGGMTGRALPPDMRTGIGASAPQILARWPGRPGMRGGVNPYVPGYQTGGDFIATGPRTIRVGEGRPEAVSIRPFSSTGAAGGGQGGAGRAKMEIDLNVKADPRLIVEATEAAMSEVADVFINITRVSREGRT